MSKFWMILSGAVAVILSAALLYTACSQFVYHSNRLEEEKQLASELKEKWDGAELNFGLQEEELARLRAELESQPEETREQMRQYANWEEWNRELEGYLNENG